MNSITLFLGWRRLLALACLAVSSLGLTFGQLPTTGWPRNLGNAQNSALSLAYGATPSLRWRAVVAGAVHIPRIGPDGTLFADVTPTSGAPYLSALNGTDGSIKWSSAGLYVNPLGALDVSGEMVGQYGPNGELGAIDTDTGKLIWYNAATVPPDGYQVYGFPIAINASGNIYDCYSFIGPELVAFSNSGSLLGASMASASRTARPPLVQADHFITPAATAISMLSGQRMEASSGNTIPSQVAFPSFNLHVN